MRIGVFDSGVGGLTVLRELIHNYPKNQYFYYGDNRNAPYGSKNKKELFDLSSKIIDFLISKDVDIIVIACGTVSSNVYDKLKKKYKLPIYDIITPVINYINDSDLNKIGLIATTATVNSKAFNSIKKEIYSKDCPLLVPIIENNDETDLKMALDEYLSYLPKDIDALILGCTHYPILLDKIKLYFNCEMINMGKILADSIKINNGINKSVRLYFSDINHNLINNVDRIIDCDYQLEEKHA